MRLGTLRSPNFATKSLPDTHGFSAAWVSWRKILCPRSMDNRPRDVMKIENEKRVSKAGGNFD